MNRLGHVVAFSILLLGLILSTGCMGGGTIGTGVTSLSHGTRNRALSFDLLVKVRDSSGKVVKGAKVIFTNSVGKYQGMTDTNGAAKINVTMVSGEEYSITVVSGKHAAHSRELISPAGRDSVSATLTISPSGAIVVSEE